VVDQANTYVGIAIDDPVIWFGDTNQFLTALLDALFRELTTSEMRQVFSLWSRKCGG